MGVLVRLWKEERGQDLVEYALLVTLVSLGAVVAVRGLATAVSEVFSNAAKNLNAAGS